MVVCQFRKTEYRDRIAETGPWAVKGALLNLQQWPPNLTLEDVSFSHCNILIQIHNLPPNRRNRENICRIVNHIGICVKFDENSTHEHLHKFVRVQVKVNIQGKLCPGIYITRENGEKLWLYFKYERLSDFCYGCGGFDHTEPTCMDEKAIRYAEHGETQVFEPWMRSSSKHNPPEKSPTITKSSSQIPSGDSSGMTRSLDMTSPLINPNTRKNPSRLSNPLQNITNLPPKPTSPTVHEMMQPKYPDLDPPRPKPDLNNLVILKTPPFVHGVCSSRKYGKEKKEKP